MSHASCDTHTTKTHPNKVHTQVVAMVAQTRQVDEWVWVWIGGCGSPNTVLLSFLSKHLGAISLLCASPHSLAFHIHSTTHCNHHHANSVTNHHTVIEEWHSHCLVCVHTFHHPFLPALSLCIHTCLWSTLLHFKTHCVFTLASHNHIVWCLCLCFWQEREKRQAMTTKKHGKEGLRFDGCWFCESPAHPLFSINPLFVFMPTPPHSTLTIPTMCFVPHSNHHQWERGEKSTMDG